MENWRRGVDKDIGLLQRDVRALQNQEASYLDWKEDVNAFMTTFNAVQARIDKESADRHQENQTRLQAMSNRISTGNLIIATLGILLTIAALILGFQAGTHHAKLDPTHLFSSDPQPAVATSAHIPTL